MRLLLLASVMVFCASSVFAQTDIKRECAKCAAIAGDAERLACFDALARSLGAGAPKAIAIAGRGKWRVREEHSPIDDRRNVYLTLDAEIPIANSLGQSVTPTLWIRCSENATNVFIDFGVYLGIDETVLMTRLDAEEAQWTKWNISTNHQAVFSPEYVATAREFMHHSKLLVQVTPYGENAVMTSFDLRGIDEAIKPLQEACSWK